MTDLSQIRARLTTSHKLGVIDSRDDDIATLLREVERLAKNVDYLTYVLLQAGWVQGEIDNAASVCEQFVSDAKRWCWIRDNGPDCLAYFEIGDVWWADWAYQEDADAKVDQAIDEDGKKHA